MRSLSKQIGRMLIASINSSALKAKTKTPSMHLPASSDSQHGCGATRMSWISSAGSEITMTATVEQQVGFYGLDLYSLHASIRAVLDFLDKVDPEAARRARYRYSCFENFGEDTQGVWICGQLWVEQELRE